MSQVYNHPILLPCGFLHATTQCIPYRDITEMCEIRDHGRAILRIETRSWYGEIWDDALSDITDFHAIRDFISSHAPITTSDEEIIKSAGSWRQVLMKWERFPKPVVRWTVPDSYLRYRTHLVVSTPLLDRLSKMSMTLVWVAVIAVPFLLYQRFFHEPLLGWIVFFIFLELFFIWGSWMLMHDPANWGEISCYEEEIVWEGCKQSWNYNYRDILGWNEIEREYEGRILYIFLFKFKDYVLDAGMDDPEKRDRLVRVLEEKIGSRSNEVTAEWE